MRAQVAFYWSIAIVIFLLVIGTLVTSSIALASTDPTKISSFLTTSVVLASLSVVALIAVFVYYTASTYNDGNWLHSIVDQSLAAKQRLRKEWADANALMQRVKSEFADRQPAQSFPSAKQAQINLKEAEAKAIVFLKDQQQKAEAAARAAGVNLVSL
jgi:hypothetical protein